MSFVGVGGLEFILVFAVALFVVGPKRLAEGVRIGRKYYTEFRRQRNELISLVNEAIDAEGIKKDLEDAGVTAELKGLKEDLAGTGVSEQLASVRRDLTIDQGDALDLTGRTKNPTGGTMSRAHVADRGDGKIAGKRIPTVAVPPPPSSSEGGQEARKQDDSA